MPQLQPGQGRTVMPSRLALEKIPYVHQAYPSHRHHPDGREIVVQNEEDDRERCPASDGWVKGSLPAKPTPKVAPVPQETALELKILMDNQTATFDKAYRQLSNEHEELKAFSAEQSNELMEVRQQLAKAQEQLRDSASANDAEGGAPPDVPAVEASKTKKK